MNKETYSVVSLTKAAFLAIPVAVAVALFSGCGAQNSETVIKDGNYVTLGHEITVPAKDVPATYYIEHRQGTGTLTTYYATYPTTSQGFVQFTDLRTGKRMMISGDITMTCLK